MKEYYDIPELCGNDEELLDISVYIVKLLKNWKFIFKAGCLGVIVGLIFALSAVKTYTVSASLIPEQAQKSNGGLSSLAAMAGVNLGSIGGSESVSPELYPQIVSTTPFKVELFSLPVTITRGREVINTDLYTYFDIYQKGAWYKKLASLPLNLVYWVWGLFDSSEEEVSGDGTMPVIDPERMTYHQAEVMHRMSKRIGVAVDKKTSLIYVNATMYDAEVARTVCDRIVTMLQDYVVKYRTEKARIDLDYYQMLNDETRDSYYAAQNKYARYVDANQGITLNSFLVERDRLQNESNLAFQLYNQTAQQLQLAQAKIQQETPVWVILEPTSIPVKGEPSRAKVLVLWAFLFCVGSVCWILFGEFVSGLFGKMKGEETEIEK